MTRASFAAWVALAAGSGCGRADELGDAAAVATTGDVAGGDAAVTPEVEGPACLADADCQAPVAACQVARCLADGACRAFWAPDGTPCDDGAPCTAADQCQGGACTGKVKACDDGEPCTGDACDPKTGACTANPRPGPCDDGDDCTANDLCVQGKCHPGTPICPCQSDAGCKDDGDLCNGVPYCDKAGPVKSCKVNPTTVVQCPAPAAGACAVAQCQAVTGKCVAVAVPDGSPCDDGAPCTTGDVCGAGACKPGTPTCCQADADCKDDGDLCNGVPYCDLAAGKCAVNPASVVVCTAAPDMCHSAACQPQSGACVPVPWPAGTPCDDGNPCTQGDSCQQGQCQPGAAVCPCTNDAGCAGNDDGDACNGLPYCDVTSGTCAANPKTVVVCPPPDVPCKTLACDPQSGACLPAVAPDGSACDADANSCTGGDACQQGVCVPGGNVCKCGKDADCLPFEDGDACNGTLYCNVAAAQCTVNPASVVTCPPQGPCAAAACDKKSGQCLAKPLPDGHACDADGLPCTANDACVGGQCLPGNSTCACLKNADCKDDGDACNGLPYCDLMGGKPQCKVHPLSIVACGPASGACAVNACNPKSGKCQELPKPDGAPCDDGQKCTQGDGCKSGMCAPGKQTCCASDAACQALDDGNLCNGGLKCDPATKACLPDGKAIVCPESGAACTTAKCQPITGACAPVPVPDGKSCDDGDACTGGDACLVGACVGKPVPCGCKDDAACAGQDDGDKCNGTWACDKSQAPAKCAPKPASTVQCPPAAPCQTVACAKATGKCVAAFAAAGSPCDDQDPCTGADLCSGGQCGGVPAACDDKDPCTSDSCLAGAGCVHPPVSCFDGSPCTADDCTPAKGCLNLPVAATCTDGDPCTLADFCSNGACKNLGPELYAKAPTAADWVGTVPDGSLYAVAWLVLGASLGSDVKVMRWNPAGAVVATKTFDQVQGKYTGERAQSGVVAASGDVVVARYLWTATAGTHSYGSALRLGPALDVQWQCDFTYGAGQRLDTVEASAGLGDDSVILVGWAQANGQPNAWAPGAARISPQGKVIWAKTVTGGGASDAASAVAAHPVGPIGLVATTPAKATRLVLLDADGQTLVSTQLGASEAKQAYTVTRSTAGGFVVAGQVVPAGAAFPKPWVAAVDSAGKVLWERVLGAKIAFTASARAVHLAPDGDLLVASQWEQIMAGQKTSRAQLARLAPTGGTRWKQELGLGVGKLFAVRQIAVPADNRLLVFANGFLARTDAWGHAMCAQAQNCLEIAAATCADDQPCTLDDCKPPTGECAHPAPVANDVCPAPPP